MPDARLIYANRPLERSGFLWNFLLLFFFFGKDSIFLIYRLSKFELEFLFGGKSFNNPRVLF